MDLIRCLIKNLRVSEDKTASRLIKFRKADDAEFQIPLVFSSVATSSDGFNICLAPVILPGPCENAINHVGFTYDRQASDFDFEITNKLTNELLASGTTSNFYDFVDSVNETSTTLFSKSIYNGDGTSGVVLVNKTQEDLRIVVTLTATNGESFANVKQEYEADYYNDVNENPTYTQIDDNSFEVCLAPSDICVALPPLDLNLAKTFYPFDTSKQYHLYYQDSEGNVEYSEIYGNQLNDTLGYITARDLRLDGFEFSAESEVGFDPDYCNEWEYTGDFYVTQNKATWLDSDYIGFFYIEMDGNRQYLDNSSKNFPHAGNGANLKSALAPYYESVAAFLREVGIDAVYKPNMWGSYNSGGITINMTEEQHSTISFGSQSGYDLKFDGYAHANCINSKTLSELPNPPSTLRIIALDGGEARKSSYTLLGSHPPINLNSINILTLFGITGNYEISSCFINISE